MPQGSIHEAVIALGASLSDPVDLSGGRPFAIQMPAAWTTAALTFEGSADGETYDDVYDEFGVEISVAAAASRMICIRDSVWLLGLRFLKIRSGTTGTPVAQAAARTLKIVTVE